MIITSDVTNHISTQVEQQFPAFYRDEGPNFIAFVEAYYEWMEQQNNPLFMTRSLQSFGDIDTTPDAFIVYFKEKYLKNIQFQTASNKRLFIKNSLDFYRAKGTERAIDLFFQLIYGLEAEVYYPGTDLFKLSEGEWVRPTYLEVTHSPLNVSYVGKQVTGVKSGATAFVDRLVRRRIHSKFIDVFYISALVGNLDTGELLSIGGALDQAPAVIGSLTSTQVVAGGQNFVIGDEVSIVSNNGVQALATVAGIANSTGEVTFTLVDGGFGYTMNASIIISQPTLTVHNIQVTDNAISTEFEQFEQLIQPLALLSYQNLSGGTFAAGQTVFEYVNNAVTGFGTVITSSPSNSTAGQLFMTIGSFAPGNVSNLNSSLTLLNTGNTISATLTGFLDQTASGNLFAEGTSANLNVNYLSRGYITGEIVVQGNSSAVITNITTIGSNAILSVANISGQLLIGGANVVGQTSNTTGVLQDIAKDVGIANTIDSFVTAPGNYVYGADSLTTANVSAVSTGSLAGFQIGSLAFPEQATLALDFLGGINTGNVEYMDILLSGTNSNVAGNGYGFPKDPSGNINTIILSCLGFEQATIGSIATITGINPGVNYNLSPFVMVIQPEVASLGIHDQVANLGLTMVGQFVANEVITQSTTIANSVVLSLTSAGPFQTNEFVYQSNGTANVATGILTTNELASNAGIVVITSTNGTFTTAFQLHGSTSNATATVTSVGNAAISTAEAIVRSVNTDIHGNVTLFLKRISLENIVNFQTVTGQTSRATGNVLSTSALTTTPVIGENAIITANVSIANGVVANLNITDSGFGYIDGELASFVSSDGSRAGTIKLSLGHQGYGTGFYRSEGGTVSGNKFLLDSDFYQEYSYEVLSRLPFDSYADTLNKVLHVAGTRSFGGVVLSSNTPVVTRPPTVIPFAHGNVDILFANATPNGMFLVGETVQQGNTFAVVVSQPEATITFTTNAMFEIGTTLVQNGAASGPIGAIDGTNFIISPVTGSFSSGGAITGRTGTLIDVTRKYELTINLPTGVDITTGSFTPGEVAYQSNGTANTVVGQVLNANSSIVEFVVTSGAMTFFSQLIGVTSTCSANVVLINGSNTDPGANLHIGDHVNQQTIRLSLVNASNTFQVGEQIFQNERVLSVANSIIFSNTASGTVLQSNAHSIEVINFFGNFTNNSILFSSNSTTTATVNDVENQVVAQGLVQAQNSTSISVYTTIGQWTPGSTVYDANSDIYATVDTVSAINGAAVVNTAINTLTLSNTASALVRGVLITSGNTIHGQTSNTTATVLSTDIEIL